MDSREIFDIRKRYNNNHFNDDIPWQYSENDKRKIIEETYNNTLKLLKHDRNNIWNIKAYIYVASDICKLYVKNKEYDKIKQCINTIHSLKIEDDDKILINTINKIKSYINTCNMSVLHH